MSGQDIEKNVSVKKLPKKRKFDLSELEDIDKPVVYEAVKSPVTVSTIQTAVIIPPQSVAVDYSCREQPEPKYANFITVEDVHGMKLDQNVLAQPYQSIVSTPKKPLLNNNSTYPPPDAITIDINEWRNHRVLAKLNGAYQPGVIHQADGLDVWVELDNSDDKLVKYPNILSTSKYDIISDASPSKGQLAIGSRVCVRKSIVFIEGVVTNILNMCFVVRLADDNHELTVKRADLRLLQPPWWEELADIDPEPIVYDEPTGYGTILQYTDGGVPLQLNQVVPTLQTGGNDYYRSTATSPLHHLAAPGSHHSMCTPLSNGSVEELRRHHYDDFGESDDELRREDIQFPTEGGKDR